MALATRHYALSVRAPTANQRRGKIESERTTLPRSKEKKIERRRKKCRRIELNDKKNDDQTQKTRENRNYDKNGARGEEVGKMFLNLKISSSYFV